jgi:hypothetical protein
VSITITTDVMCDGCGDWTHGVTGAGPSGVAARRVAKRCGWAHVKGAPGGGMLDLCPECVAKRVVRRGLRSPCGT